MPHEQKISSGGREENDAEEGKQSITEGDRPHSLFSWIREVDENYALALAPGFFGFFAHLGCLKALDEANLLGRKISYISGSSAGALVGGMYAAGMSVDAMIETVLSLERKDYWDFPGIGGLLRGNAFKSLVRNALPANIKNIEDCSVKFGLTAYSISSLQTKCIRQGDIASSILASCTFPFLFQPVVHPQGLLIDGGVQDIAGLWAIPDNEEGCRRILNITFGDGPFIDQVIPPSKFPSPSSPRMVEKEIVSLVLSGLPKPHPFAHKKGIDAINAAYNLVKRALHKSLLPAEEPNHYIVPTEVASKL